MSMLSGGDADLKAIKCRYLIDRLDRWTQNAKTLDTDVPEIVTTCQRLSSGFLALSQTVDGEVWEWLRALVPEERGPLARALTKSFAQAELVHLSRIAPILDSSISFCASAPPGPVSQVLVSDESVVELARRQLQELVIPKITPFEGDVLAYQEFKRTFQFEINKLSLPPHRRLQALKSCLKGPPLSIIQNSTPTEEGYSSAWETLDARYEGKLRTASALFETFLQVPEGNPTIDECIAWISRRQMLLDQHDIPQPLDFLLCHVILSALSANLQEEFRKKYLRSFDELPQSAQVLEFLKNQEDKFAPKITLRKSTSSPQDVTAPSSRLPEGPSSQQSETPSLPRTFFKPRAVSTLKPSKTHTPKSAKSPPPSPKKSSSPIPARRTPPSTSRAPSPPVHSLRCYFCDEWHLISNCNEYLRLPVSNRWSFITENHLCVNCFSKSHSVAQCPRSAGCLECAGAHHTTLHPPPPSSSLSQRTLPDVVIPPLMSLSPKLTKKLPDPSPRRAVPHLRDDVSYPSTSSGSSTLSSLPTIYFGSDSPKATF